MTPPRRWAFALLALAVALSFLSPMKYLAGTSNWVKLPTFSQRRMGDPAVGEGHGRA